jgi:malate dehydrogenase
MDITVIGAGGSVGRTITQMLVAERLLSCEQRLILVGNPEGSSARSLFGFVVDLQDAYAEIAPQIEVVLSPEAVTGDLIVMAGGTTLPLESTRHVSRDVLASNNYPLFEQYATALAAHGNGHEIVICVTNPNELAVAAFAEHLGRKRVIGMGAFLDSLRFRKEIALDLGIRRQRVHGFMAGEHGINMVPLWSSVHIYGLSAVELQTALTKIRRGLRSVDFHAAALQAMKTLRSLVAEGQVRQALAFVNEQPPDVRVVLKPFVTHFSGAKTAVGTAAATMELLRTITTGHDTLVSGQLTVEGEFHGIHSTLGVPFVIGNQGVERIIELSLDAEEVDLLTQSAVVIQEKIVAYCELCQLPQSAWPQEGTDSAS